MNVAWQGLNGAGQQTTAVQARPLSTHLLGYTSEHDTESLPRLNKRESPRIKQSCYPACVGGPPRPLIKLETVAKKKRPTPIFCRHRNIRGDLLSWAAGRPNDR